MTDMLDELQARHPALADPAPTIDPVTPRLETRSQWLKANPPSPQRLKLTLALLAGRLREGEDLHYAMHEFLDEFALRLEPSSRVEAIHERPPDTDVPRFEAILGALAEHLAVTHDLERPRWALEPGRFLEQF